MKKIIFNKHTGEILARTDHYQEINILFKDYPAEFRSELDSIVVENSPRSLRGYIVKDGKLKRGDMSGI